MVSSLGVGRIYVSGAARCPKDYFSSHLLRDDDVSRANLRAALVEGLTPTPVIPAAKPALHGTYESPITRTANTGAGIAIGAFLRTLVR